MPDLPSGTVTFLFTDIEGSTVLWERDRPAMLAAVERHLVLLRGVIEEHRGALYKTVGDGTQSAFSAARDASPRRSPRSARSVANPGPISQDPSVFAWRCTPERRSRRTMTILAAPLNRLARLLGMAQGSQILLTEAVEQLTQDDLPSGASLRDLGEVRLRDLERPERVFALIHPDLLDTLRLLKSETGRIRHFPTSLTPFLGRENRGRSSNPSPARTDCAPRHIDRTRGHRQDPHGIGGRGTRRQRVCGWRRLCRSRCAARTGSGAPSHRNRTWATRGSGRPLLEVVQGYLASGRCCCSSTTSSISLMRRPSSRTCLFPVLREGTCDEPRPVTSARGAGISCATLPMPSATK